MGRRFEAWKRLQLEEPTLYAWLLALLSRYDPIGLSAMGAPDDEYAPEVGTILPRLQELERVGKCTEGAVRAVLHEEFVHWLGSSTARDEAYYSQIAREVCEELPGRLSDRLHRR
jgi:hypothetical protein